MADFGRHERKIKDMLETYEPNHSSKCTIYRIPDYLRKVNAAAYTPRVVSIGPIHHNNSAFHTMEMHKRGYLQAFLKRTKKKLEDLIAYIVECEDRVHNSYEPIDWGDDYCSMVLLDGAFIIEYFTMVKEGTAYDFTDLQGKSLNQPLNIDSDLILLENQLPFFILEGLYNLAFPPNGTDGQPTDDSPPAIPSFLELACFYFAQYNYMAEKPEVQQVEHFTDLLRKSHQCSIMSPFEVHQFLATRPKIFKLFQCSKSATVLHEAGVKFKASEGTRLCDIKFKDGVLEIPCFTFQRSTESFVRNLIAFEQCHYPYEPYMCHYFFFLDNLINTAKDVDLLVKKGIIINLIGDSDAVANLVNKVSTNFLVFRFGFYAYICFALNTHCDNPWHRWKVAFKRDYLSTPWKIASTTAAVILLSLTFIQTVCSIIDL